MKTTRNIIGLIILISIFGCNNYEPNTKSMSLASIEFKDTQAEPKQPIEIERKLIKDGEVEFETNNLTKTRKDIFKAIEKFKAYFSSDNEYKNSYEISNSIIIRVPTDKFDALLKEITIGVERFDRKQITIKDVTEEFLDIETRLRTKKELEKRYLEILKKANSVTEILEVEKQIGELRSQIESIEGRLKYLENRVSFSTLKVRIYEKITEQTKFGNKFKEGFKKGWENLIHFFVFLVNIWPFIIIFFGVLIFIRIWRKKRKLRK